MTNPLDEINRVISQQTGATTAPATKGLVCKKCSHAFEHNQADMPPTNCPACGELTSFIVYGSLKMAQEYAAKAPREEEVIWEQADPITDPQQPEEHAIPFSPKSEAYKDMVQPEIEPQIQPEQEVEKPKRKKATKPAPIPVPPPPPEETDGEEDGDENEEVSADREEWLAKLKAAREALIARYKLDTLMFRPIGTAEAFAYGTTVWEDGLPEVYVWENYLEPKVMHQYIRELAMDVGQSGLGVDCVQLTDISPELGAAMPRRAVTASIVRKEGKALGPIRVKLGDKVNIGAKVSQKGTIVLQVLNVIK